jgi:hypothetical protein
MSCNKIAGGDQEVADYGPFLLVGDRQLSKVQRPVSRFAQEIAPHIEHNRHDHWKIAS